MRSASFRRLVPILASLNYLVALGACDDSPTGADGAFAVGVLLDTMGTLEAVAGAEDTIDVVVPGARLMGTIIEASARIQLRYGPGRYDVVHSGYGGAFAAIVPQVGTGPVRLRVQRARPEIERVEYRVRIVAVDDQPEHAGADLAAGGGFAREWLDPPLDRDVFEVDLPAGTDFRAELEPLDDDVRLTALLLPPRAAGYYLFLEAGPSLARSEVHTTTESGAHRLVVYGAGLRPDVEAAYRLRVVVLDD